MSTPDGDSTVHLLRFLAVGRLVAGPDGRWAEGKHIILCYQVANGDSLLKNYKSHIKAIMNKGASKLENGKRIRLTSDSNDYDLHVLADYVNDEPTQVLVFFAITDPAFPKHHTVGQLFKDMKQQFYETYPEIGEKFEELTSTKTTLRTSSQSFLNYLFNQYSTSRLSEVNMKVERVRETMKTNVQKALNNVEQLEEMETKSEQFEEHARQFSRNANKVKSMFRSRFYKITCVLIVVVAAIIAYIIYAIYKS